MTGMSIEGDLLRGAIGASFGFDASHAFLTGFCSEEVLACRVRYSNKAFSFKKKRFSSIHLSQIVPSSRHLEMSFSSCRNHYSV